MMDIHRKLSCRLDKIFILILWLSIIIGFYMVARFTPLAIDDFNYVFINSPVELQDFNPWPGILNIYTEYFSGVGRFIPHLFVGFFTDLTGKGVFNFFDTVAFIFLSWMIAKIVSSEKGMRPYIALLTFAIIWFLMPGIFQSCLWMAGTCNYLFVACFITVFYYELIKEPSSITNRWSIPLWFLLGFMTGWSNEGFSIGLCAGCTTHFTIHHKLLTTKRISLMGGVIVGTVFLCLTPFNLFRFISGQENIKSFQEIIMATGQSVIAMKNLRISFLLILFIEIIYLFKLLPRKIIRSELNKNAILVIAWIVSFLFIVFTHHEAVYSRFPIEIFATMILMSLIIKTLDNNILKKTGIISGLLVTVSFLFIIPAVHANYKSNEDMKGQIIAGDTLIVVNHMNGNSLTSRYFLPPLKCLYPGPLPVADHIIRYYSGNPNAIIIGKNTYDMLSQGKSEQVGSLMIDPDIHSVWVKVSGLKDIEKATLLIEPLSPAELNPIQKLLYPYTDRYKMTRFETKDFKTVTLFDERWMVMRHYPMLDDRLTGIEIQQDTEY